MLKSQTPLEDKKRQLVEEFKIPMTEEIECEVVEIQELYEWMQQKGGNL
ncbi:MAG: hypothetical protein R3Y24_09165 [Eubacteriales bacterium]